MFTTGWAAPRRRSACRTADDLPLSRTTLTQQQLDILAQRALIAFEGEDMIFSPESPVNEPRPRLDPEPKGRTPLGR